MRPELRTLEVVSPDSPARIILRTCDPEFLDSLIEANDGGHGRPFVVIPWPDPVPIIDSALVWDAQVGWFIRNEVEVRDALRTALLHARAEGHSWQELSRRLRLAHPFAARYYAGITGRQHRRVA